MPLVVIVGNFWYSYQGVENTEIVEVCYEDLTSDELKSELENFRKVGHG